MVGVEDLAPSRELDVAGRDLGRSRHAQMDRSGFLILALDDEALQIEHDIGDVLGHSFDRGELVEHVVDLDLGDGRTRDRRQKRATERVPERVTEAGLERLDRELRSSLRYLVL